MVRFVVSDFAKHRTFNVRRTIKVDQADYVCAAAVGEH